MRWSCWSQSMTWAKTSLKVMALPPRVGWYPGCARPVVHRTIIVDAAPCLAGKSQRMLCRGFQFVADAPNTNAIGQQVLYFDTTTSMGSRMHLTQLPA